MGIIFLAASPGFCAPPAQLQAIDKIETAMFGFTYGDETEELRLDRIEESVYGKKNTGNITQRFTKLKNDLSADLLGKEIAPKEDTFSDDSDKIKEPTVAGNPTGAAAGAPGVDYPAINELEKLVFNQEFKSTDLNSRLAKLEEKTFKKTYANDDFSTRADRLRAQLKPRSLMDNAIAQSSNDFYDGDAVELDKNYNLQSYDPDRFDYDSYNSRNNARFEPKFNLATAEKSMFKRSYQDDSMESRLARVESSMFGTTFDNDSQHERLNRIASAHSAQKTAKKYDNNRLQQKLATGMQIGMFILMLLACVL
ncbi:MAG: hypothetical protein LBJ74_03435 [Heliobacteriaceae bacterium]|jgi:hypothetical protein|nr:hypothetical protein [Heliobacteriaceae bacterium]